MKNRFQYRIFDYSGESGGVDTGFVGSIVEVDGLRVQVDTVDLEQPSLFRRAMNSQIFDLV